MNSENGLVSIILPTYNRSEYLKKSIDSCLNQTYGNIELIIVDDGSTDRTPDIIKTYRDGRIKYIRHEKNLSLSRALNDGFSASHGGYLSWTSDDNLYHPTAISVLVNEIEKVPGIGLICANYFLINAEGSIIKKVTLPTIENLPFKNCIGSCFLYTKKVYETTGNYKLDLPFVEDYEYWIRVSLKFKIKQLNKFLYYHREHSAALSARVSSKVMAHLLFKVRKKYFAPYKVYFAMGIFWFGKGKKQKARKFLLLSLFRNPFNKKLWQFINLHSFDVWVFLPSGEKYINKAKRIFIKLLLFPTPSSRFRISVYRFVPIKIIMWVKTVRKKLREF